MPDSVAFEWLCKELEQSSILNRLEARGTVRLTLKQAGLEPRSVTCDQLAVVVEELLPGELLRRGIEEAEVLSSDLLSRLREQGPTAEEPQDESPEEAFRRFGDG